MKMSVRYMVLAAIAGLSLWTGPAMACPMMAKASPRVGSTVTMSPAEVSLHFTGPMLAKGSVLEVHDSDGHLVSYGAVHQGQSDADVSVAVHPLPPGTYKVSWEMHCNCEPGETNIIPGHFTFTVAAPGDR